MIVLDVTVHEILASVVFILSMKYVNVCMCTFIYTPDMSPVHSFKKWMTFNFLYSVTTNSIFRVDTKPERVESKKKEVLTINTDRSKSK